MILKTLPFAPYNWGGMVGVLPRLICQYDRETCSNSAVEELISNIETNFGKSVVGVWCNLYRDGNEYCGYHSDQYENDGNPIDVFTFTFGATRRFLLKPDGTGTKSIGFDLGHGDLFYFDSKTNAGHKHSIPKTKKAVGPRISIVLFVV